MVKRIAEIAAAGLATVLALRPAFAHEGTLAEHGPISGLPYHPEALFVLVVLGMAAIAFAVIRRRQGGDRQGGGSDDV